jgi:hypothetical protein
MMIAPLPQLKSYICEINALYDYIKYSQGLRTNRFQSFEPEHYSRYRLIQKVHIIEGLYCHIC